jgi:hypothetical protein
LSFRRANETIRSSTGALTGILNEELQESARKIPDAKRHPGFFLKAPSRFRELGGTQSVASLRFPVVSSGFSVELMTENPIPQTQNLSPSGFSHQFAAPSEFQDAPLYLKPAHRVNSDTAGFSENL